MIGRIGIIIQARMNSTRLPGKVMKQLAGKAVLYHVVERCKKSVRADAVVVATTIYPSDDRIVDFCQENGIAVIRGSEKNVLSRFYKCARAYQFDAVVRVCADNPLIDSEMVDACIAKLRRTHKSGIEYVSNLITKGYPKGLDVEVFTFSALDKARTGASTKEELEHVTPHMRKSLKIAPYTVPEAFQGDYRLTLDEQDDFRLLEHIYKKFYKEGNIIDLRGVIAYLKRHPDVAVINKNIQQRVPSY